MSKKQAIAQTDKKKLPLRIYRQFDIDLIYLFEYMKEHELDLSRFIKQVVRQYLGKRVPSRPAFIAEVRKTEGTNPLTLRRKIQYDLMLDVKADADVLDFIEGIKIGYRNATIKGLIRAYIGDFMIYPCIKTTQITFTGRDAEFLREGEDRLG